MAEGAVTFFLENLSSLLTREANLLLGVDEQIRSLHDELEWIRSFLRDADQKRKKYERVKVWVSQIRDLAYDAEDIIDAFVLKVEQQRQKNLGLIGFIRRYLLCANQLTAIHKVGKQIEEINRRVEKVSASKAKYGLEYIQPGESSGSLNEDLLLWKEKRPALVEDFDMVVGLKDHKKTVVKLLTEGNARRTVVSVVGMGGLGKTTLAKKAFNSKTIKEHFNCHAWIYVSQEYRMRELLQGVIKCIMVLSKDDKENVEKMNEEDLGTMLSDHLKQKRYLIVVDDLWTIEDWEKLKVALPEGEKGSKILLTTRNRDVALHANPPGSPYELPLLNNEESWQLFLKKVFLEFDEHTINMPLSCPPELEKLGKQIVEKCSGLPLAIVVLGGLLSRKDRTPSAWSKVLESANWHLTEELKQCSEILALSYHDLPYYLKSCFLYCGLFPPDLEIRASKLIQLWIAEGFIQQRGEETLEDIAEDYLEELVHRSMIQVAERRSDGGIRACCVHDLLRNFAISEAKRDKFFDIDGKASPSIVRRLAIHRKADDYSAQNTSTRSLRSFLCFTESLEKQQWGIVFGGLKLLKVMDLENVIISRLPKEVGELIHLRYLSLRLTNIPTLPSSICNLCNLQTLDLRYTRIIHLPNAIWNMRQLRHLYVDYGKIGRHPRPQHLKELRSLWLGGGHKNKIPSLMSFPHNFHLHKLYLNGLIEELPHPQDFPPNLTKLSLRYSKLDQDLITTLEKLPNLRILKLLKESYIGAKMVCSRRGFPQLQFLELRYLDILEEWRVEEGAMLSLRHLEIDGCIQLKMLPDGLQHLTALQELEVRYMPNEFKVGLGADGVDWHKIRHIPSLTIVG
ncbi:PREDICTED: putative disease resistance protein At1g50180 [Nelumbo nucifera]|uniref:Disease resistance protein At1g50180 n=1 Tax=Nelumbo nucifera TaxID=4432 RepID=A0A1U8A240_NELNU|nr:PREDICTED: putative disease resistance protein At1g50180 [Nelumbo nucifera]